MTTTITTARQRLQLPLPQRNWRPKFPGDDLNETVYMFEDFLGGNITGTINPVQWNSGGSGGSGALAADPNNTNGVWVLTSGSSSKLLERWLNMSSKMFDGRNPVTVTWRCKINNVTNVWCECGLADVSGNDPNRQNGSWWRLSTATSPNWYVVNSLNYGTSEDDMGVVADTNWHEFTLVVTTTSVMPFLDGVPYPPNEYYIPPSVSAPGGSLAPFIFIQNVGKNERLWSADYCEVYCAREM